MKTCFSCRALRERNLLVDVLSVIYGCGSWIAMTGLWIELPLLVQRLPEGWKLASRLTLALQVANVGPIIYGLLNRWYPRAVNERSGSHAQLAIGSLSTLLLIFFWTSTVQIAGLELALALYVLSFGLSIVDCTSSVVFLPYMANFKPIYLIPYLAGEGLSGLLPSLVGSAQGIDDEVCVNETVTTIRNDTLLNETTYELIRHVGDPRFEPQWFFGFLFGMVLLSWIAFCLMDCLDICRAEMVTCNATRESSMYDFEMTNWNYHDNWCSANQMATKSGYPSFSLYLYLLFLQFWASLATFGVFPAIQTYSCLPYGDTSFHAAVVLGGAAYPISCLMAMFLEIKGTLTLSILSFIATAVSVFVMYTAATSPIPPMVDTVYGPPVIVASWVVLIWIFSYVKTMVTAVVGEHWGQRGLFWIGAVTQGGAAIGAITMFVLVNIIELFEESRTSCE